MKGSDKNFFANEKFQILQYNDKKVTLMKGKYIFNARNYQDAFEKFADLIKPIVMKDTDAEFGLIGNKRLLATTSIFKDSLKVDKFELTGEEYGSDEISMIMLGYGLKENIIEWASDIVLEGREY
jgi:hypothetical protein